MKPEAKNPKMFDGTGKLNRYTCENCGGSIVTIDREQGVTPFLLACKTTVKCQGWMQSAMYRGVTGEPSFEWRKPTPTEYEQLDRSMKEHVDRGGLKLFPIIKPEQVIDNTGAVEYEGAFEIVYGSGYPRVLRSVLIKPYATPSQVVRAFLAANALEIPVEVPNET